MLRVVTMRSTAWRCRYMAASPSDVGAEQDALVRRSLHPRVRRAHRPAAYSCAYVAERSRLPETNVNRGLRRSNTVATMMLSSNRASIGISSSRVVTGVGPRQHQRERGDSTIA